MPVYDLYCRWAFCHSSPKKPSLQAYRTLSYLFAVGGKVGALTSAAFAAEEQQQFPWHNPQQHSQHCQPLTWEAQKQQQQPLWLLQRRGPWDLQQLQLNQQLCSSMTSSSSRAYSTSAANPMLASSPQPVLSSALAATRHDQQCSLLQQLPQQQQHWHSQLQHLRGVKQLRPYAAAPEPLPRFKKPSKDGRLNRMVIRLPPQVQLELKDQHLIFTGGPDVVCLVQQQLLSVTRYHIISFLCSYHKLASMQAKIWVYARRNAV